MSVYTFTAWKMWFRNYYVAYALYLCVKIKNEELCFPFENAYYFWIGLDMVRMMGNLSSTVYL